MNEKQKIILAIFIPIVIFFVALSIAYYASVTRISSLIVVHNPFDWGKTWYIWFFALLCVCLFEYILFEEK